MPLDTIYLTRHGVGTYYPSSFPFTFQSLSAQKLIARLTSLEPQHRLNWTIDFKTGRYHAQFPTPTGNPADPTLTSHGVRQSDELAAHLASPAFGPKPCRVYCSPFYRCLQTIRPAVEALKKQKKEVAGSDGDDGVDLDVRVENGLG